MRTPQLDNVTYSQKVMLRQTALRLLGNETPVILETHGGRGDVWSALYTGVEDGVVFDIDPERAAALAEQRPTWSVYQADVEAALAEGAARHLVFNYVDVDPYGSCWETLKGFFGSKRSFAPRLVLVVNDGLRHKVRGGAAWHVGALEDVVRRYGNHAVWKLYPDVVARELLVEAAGLAGYTVTHFESYATGVEQKMTHILAVLERDGSQVA